MRRFEVRLFWLPLLLLACSANNTVAGDGRSTAEQLEAEALSRCESACDKLALCAEGDECDCTGDVCDCAGVDVETCPGQCQELLTGYARKSEACANVGQRLLDCIDAASCNDLSQPRFCDPSDAEKEACEEDEGSEPLPGDDGPSSGGTSSVPAPSGNVVSCSTGFGTGGGAPAGGGSYVSCEQGMQLCSDGHEYRVICVTSELGVASCSCYQDEVPSGSAFQPVGGCPLVAEVNRGCGWSLASF